MAGRDESERCGSCGHFPDECGCTCCWPGLPAPVVVTDTRSVDELFADIARQNPEAF